MKCEKCQKNEANFYYKETINGKTTEKHLCSDCAREEGLTSAFEWQNEDMFPMMNDFFSPAPMLHSFFGDSALRRMQRTLFAPMTMPFIEIGQMEPDTKSAHASTESEAEASVPDEADAEMSRKREIQSLKSELHDAVQREDFEKAIELRDRLHKLEGKE